jgi:hypothetical protein
MSVWKLYAGICWKNAVILSRNRQEGSFSFGTRAGNLSYRSNSARPPTLVSVQPFLDSNYRSLTHCFIHSRTPTRTYLVRLEVLMAANMKVAVIWIVWLKSIDVSEASGTSRTSAHRVRGVTTQKVAIFFTHSLSHPLRPLTNSHTLPFTHSFVHLPTHFHPFFLILTNT